MVIKLILNLEMKIDLMFFSKSSNNTIWSFYTVRNRSEINVSCIALREDGIESRHY